MREISLHHEYLFQVGDKVRVRFNREYTTEYNRKHPLGATGEIVGFAIHSVCRRLSQIVGQLPGIYLERRYPFVRFDTNTVRNMKVSMLELIDEAEYSQRLERSAFEVWDQHAKYRKFISELPYTEIWEGDVVRPKGRKPERVRPDSIPGLPEAYMVTYMTFHPRGTIVESLDNEPYFSIGDRFRCYAEDEFIQRELELIERGNIWRRAHGEPLVFKDLEEESFWAWQAEEVEYISEPEGPAGWWPKASIRWNNEADALAYIQAGNGHGLQAHRMLAMGSEEWWNVLRFKDEDLGRRVAEATQKGFRIPSDTWVEDKYWKET